MILCDPPYGVAYVENKKHFKDTIGSNIKCPNIIKGDKLQTDVEYAQFTQDWLEQVKDKLESYNTSYIFNSDLMVCALIGETVYDPFGGSGSTLIACEHVKRKCIMIEMESSYCDTIIKRWELLTKEKAEKLLIK